MQVKKNKLILIFFILFSISVLAEPQIPVTDSSVLSIAYPKLGYFDVNKGITLHFDVYSANASLLSGDEADCLIAFYKEDTITRKNLTFDEDFEIELNQSLFPEGAYYYTIYCNATNGENAFVSDSFSMNIIGEEKGGYEKQWFFLFIVLISIFLIVMGFYKDDFALVSVGGMALGLLGGYIYLNGFSTFNNAVSNGIAFILMIVGAYFFLRPIIEWVTEEMNKLG